MAKIYLLILVLGLLFFSCDEHLSSTKVEHQLEVSGCEVSDDVEYEFFSRDSWEELPKQFFERVSKEIKSLKRENNVIMRIDWIYDGNGYLESCMIQYKKKRKGMEGGN